jgi:hypothetical protein
MVLVIIMVVHSRRSSLLLTRHPVEVCLAMSSWGIPFTGVAIHDHVISWVAVLDHEILAIFIPTLALFTRGTHFGPKCADSIHSLGFSLRLLLLGVRSKLCPFLIR